MALTNWLTQWITDLTKEELVKRVLGWCAHTNEPAKAGETCDCPAHTLLSHGAAVTAAKQATAVATEALATQGSLKQALQDKSITLATVQEKLEKVSATASTLAAANTLLNANVQSSKLVHADLKQKVATLTEHINDVTGKLAVASDKASKITAAVRLLTGK